MKIGFFEIEGWEEELLLKQFSGHELSFSKEKIDPAKLTATNFDAISIFVESHLDRSILNLFPNLKFITTRSTGYDHIDLAACKERGIVVSFVPGYGDNTVAEYAFGLILNLTRKIYDAIDQIKEKESFSLLSLRGIDLKGRTIGVIGAGRIGQEVVKIAKGFGMNVLATSPHQDAELAQKLGFTYSSLEDLLKNSDIITIHCPYNQSTHHLINRQNISLIKKGAYLINTARGAIVETQALVEALKNGTLAGAGLDVLEEENLVKDELNFLSSIKTKEEDLRTILYDHVLMKMPNVLITPHNAFDTKEALQRILDTTVENIKGFMGQSPVNLVS
ncbi:hydroxyacid dehydrogenase [Patescibacteria group bacterium]|nr:hydroxyacid dehydrogenase [Patescibacteria group bacterium]